jgi:hypothetical protein
MLWAEWVIGGLAVLGALLLLPLGLHLFRQGKAFGSMIGTATATLADATAALETVQAPGSRRTGW